MIERRRYQAEVSQQQHQERQEKLSEAMSLLERGIEGILDSEGFAKYLKTMAHFHTYSFGNVALIVAQRPEATEVAGYPTDKATRGIRYLGHLASPHGEALKVTYPV